MQWLSQYWVWVLLAIGAFYFFFRRAHYGVGGFGHGGHSQHADRHTGDSAETAVDPVSGKAVDTTHAVTSLYQGQAYFFETAENRERFEATPERYVHGDGNGPAASSQHRRGRHGCC